MNRYLLSLALGVVSLSALPAGARGLPAADFIPWDAVTGTGIIYKNQVPSGDPAGDSFTLESTSTYSAVCTWSKQNRTRYPYTHTSGDVVNSRLFYYAGLHQVFGAFELTGFGSHFESGDTLPVVGSVCQRGQGGTWTSVDLISSAGGLYVIYGTTKTLIY